MLAHLRTEAYEVYRRPGYASGVTAGAGLSYRGNLEAIAAAKRDLDARHDRAVEPGIAPKIT